VVAERSRAPELRAFLQQPRREARRLAGVLGEYWQRALAPASSRVRALLEADLGRRARRLSETGAGRRSATSTLPCGGPAIACG